MKTFLFLTFLLAFSFSCSKENSEADRADSILALLKNQQVKLDGATYNTAIDTVVDNNPVEPGTTDIKLASLSNEDNKKLRELVSKVDKETLAAFDEKIKSWINLWADIPTYYSDPVRVLHTDSKEYKTYIDFCIEKNKAVLPLLFELLTKTDNQAHFYLLSYPLVADILPELPLYRKYLDQSIENYKVNKTNSDMDGNSEIVMGFVHNVLNSEF